MSEGPDKVIADAPPTILLLDDDEAFTRVYQEMLSQHIPCHPQVRVANSGARALSMLETDPCNLLILDLNLPKMDGLQVLSAVRRKFPEIRIVVLTSVRDEQFRGRAYSMGVDQYWIKPDSDQELNLFMESMQAMLTKDAHSGFRGIQSKSLVDIIQLECISHNSCLLKITNGMVDGHIWIQNGEVIDAETAGLTGEPGFQRMLAWKNGSFELLPPDPKRKRSIFISYQGLLLNTAQALDEAQSQRPPDAPGFETEVRDISSLLAEVAQTKGIEFVLALYNQQKPTPDCWGLENPKPLAAWLRDTQKRFDELSEKLQFGPLRQINGTAPNRRFSVAPCRSGHICVGFDRRLTRDQAGQLMKQVLTLWAS